MGNRILHDESLHPLRMCQGHAKANWPYRRSTQPERDFSRSHSCGPHCEGHDLELDTRRYSVHCAAFGRVHGKNHARRRLERAIQSWTEEVISSYSPATSLVDQFKTASCSDKSKSLVGGIAKSAVRRRNGRARRCLTDLARLDLQQSRIVKLRFFGGLSVEETADILEVSSATVKRKWSTARAIPSSRNGRGVPVCRRHRGVTIAGWADRATQ
jgi:DNA-binding transcriptional regulator YiaG